MSPKKRLLFFVSLLTTLGGSLALTSPATATAPYTVYCSYNPPEAAVFYGDPCDANHAQQACAYASSVCGESLEVEYYGDNGVECYAACFQP
jgi:hypothetical protein